MKNKIEQIKDLALKLTARITGFRQVDTFEPFNNLPSMDDYFNKVFTIHSLNYYNNQLNKMNAYQRNSEQCYDNITDVIIAEDTSLSLVWVCACIINNNFEGQRELIFTPEFNKALDYYEEYCLTDDDLFLYNRVEKVVCGYIAGITLPILFDILIYEMDNYFGSED